MPQPLHVALCQLDLHWENPSTNLQKLEEHFKLISEAELIVLPEMFSTGFSMNPKDFAAQSDQTLDWMIEQAKKHQAAIYGSLMVVDEGKYYNRGYFVYPEGHYEYYDKRHLFSLEGEEKVYSPGSEKKTIEYRGWRINLQICYDLRFPAWCRNDQDFDLQIYVANWPERRHTAWKTLLKARAIENLCYVIGVNRVGDDGNGIYHSGDTILRDPIGRRISYIEPGIEACQVLVLDYQKITDTRAKFSFLEDRDDFSLNL